MHPSTVLREEVFAVEVVVATITSSTFPRSRRVVGVAVAFGAAVEAELEVLGGDVAFPFVFGGEDGGAAVVGECAGELLGGFSLVIAAFSRGGGGGGAGSDSSFGVGGVPSVVGVGGFDDFVMRGEGWGGCCALEGPRAAGGAAACAAGEGGVFAVLHGAVFGVVV